MKMIKGFIPMPIKKAIKKFGRLLAIERNCEALKHDITMPKYLYHSPLDYSTESHAPNYGPPVIVEGEDLPVPPPECRPGYSPVDHHDYLRWGRSDANFIRQIIAKHGNLNKTDLEILDWGCSSGRVLRHFYTEQKQLGWRLHGIDIQAYLVEWMRQYLPGDFDVFCGSTIPHLPFRDSSLDVIYGISVFTHTKYLWDAWLCEFRRVLKPNGLCLMTVQCETAWKFYHQNRHLDWVNQNHPKCMLMKPEMNEDFFFFGDGFISQNFFKSKVVKNHFGRYLKVVDFLDPPDRSFQNWIVMKNTE